MATSNRPKNDWIELLQQVTATKADKIPPGYKSAPEWLKEFEISEGTWKRKIPLLEEAGKMTVGHFRVIDRAGRLVNRKFWKKA